MLEYFAKELREGLQASRLARAGRKSRLRVQVGDAVYPVLRMWSGGFSLDAALAPNLRGRVDLFDGARHLSQWLIVASSEADGEIVCDFKRSTPARETAPLDFWADENAPRGFLPRP